MRERTPSCLGGLRPAPQTPYRRLRLLAPLLLILGILVVSDLNGQQPQPKRFSGFKQKLLEKAKDFAKEKEKIPPDAVPQVPPAALEVNVQQFLMANPAQRFQFKIDPKAPQKDLLPTPPKIERLTDPFRTNDLSRVPEVQFEASHGKANADALQHIAHQIAKINHLNGKKTDGFLEALLSERPDLTGLPFAMGDACRTKGERSKQFALAVATVRQALQSPAPAGGPAPTSTAVPLPAPPAGATPTAPSAGAIPPPSLGGGTAVLTTNRDGPALINSVAVFSTATTFQASVNAPAPETFWDLYQTLCNKEDKAQSRREQRELITCARIAALMQILLPMTQMHPGLVEYLSTISHVEATKALARLAIFSSAEDARKAALEALKVRRERDYTDILLSGLRYPWPTVARRAALAITKLERNDLLPKLVDVLEEPDPRAPVMREVKGKTVPVVSEMVRVNHHRSCLLCHAPGNTGKVSADAVTAEVPVPGQPLTPPSGGYSTSQPDILVRIDVTYLRQDFSTFLAVADANPWPEMQRFDFLVRTRVLSDEEATAYREQLKPHEPGEFSPYHRAALSALRELTGRDTEPTPEAWRRLLKLPAESPRKTATP
jgi:hypothetical protein